MPKTKLESFFFTLLTSGVMIYWMGVYNTALHTGGLTYAAFGKAAHTFPLEWLVGFLFAFFWRAMRRRGLHFTWQIPIRTGRFL